LLGVDPWSWYLPANRSTHDIDPGIKDYTRLFVLPTPITMNNTIYQIAMMGKKGVVVLLNTDMDTIDSLRMYWPLHGSRPFHGSSSSSCADASTAVLVGTGEILTYGGCSSSWIDLYDPLNDTWRSMDSGIVRNTPSAALLPDGSVLLINGENPAVDQSSTLPQSGDPRFPQLFDPFTFTLTTFSLPESSPSPFRGYHNNVALLKSAHILLGGGVHARGDVGCEQPNMRVLELPYVQGKERPVWMEQQMIAQNTFLTTTLDNNNVVDIPLLSPTSPSPLLVRVGGSLPVSWNTSTGLSLRTRGAAVLMALQGFTHSYDHNQVRRKKKKKKKKKMKARKKGDKERGREKGEEGMRENVCVQRMKNAA
jgi:hypothetical protein